MRCIRRNCCSQQQCGRTMVWWRAGQCSQCGCRDRQLQQRTRRCTFTHVLLTASLRRCRLHCCCAGGAGLSLALAALSQAAVLHYAAPSAVYYPPNITERSSSTTSSGSPSSLISLDRAAQLRLETQAPPSRTAGYAPGGAALWRRLRPRFDDTTTLMFVYRNGRLLRRSLTPHIFLFQTVKQRVCRASGLRHSVFDRATASHFQLLATVCKSPL